MDDELYWSQPLNNPHTMSKLELEKHNKLAHGSMNIELDNYVFKVYVSQDFNVEGIQFYDQNFIDKIKGFDGHPWAVMHIYNEHFLATPESYQYIRQQFEWCFKKNCRSLALVTDSGLIKNIVSTHMEGLPIAYQTFSDEDTAFQWSLSNISR